MRPNYTTFLLVDSSCLNSSMVRTNVTPCKGEGKRQVEVLCKKIPKKREIRPGCTYLLWCKDPHCQCTPIFSTRDPSRARGEGMCRGGRATGRGGEVTTVITNLTVGLDDHGIQAIYVRRGGASLQEALTYCGRQGPPEGILVGWASKEAPEVLTRYSGTL